jgi:transposase
VTWLFAAIPEETAQAVRANPRKYSRYRRVGDHINSFLSKRALDEVDFASEKPPSFFAILALVTFFQYAEKLTDQDAFEAVRTRPEWKYALHLPLSYPGFDPVWLCRLRKYTRQTTIGMAVIQAVSDRLGKTGYFDQIPEADEVVSQICQRNRMANVASSMLLAVETLAASKSAWLNGLPLADLYENYARILRIMPEMETSEALIQLVTKAGSEIHELLRAVDASGQDDLNSLIEIQYLKEIWKDQYEYMNQSEQSSERMIWRRVDCKRCEQKT